MFALFALCMGQWMNTEIVKYKLILIIHWNIELLFILQIYLAAWVKIEIVIETMCPNYILEFGNTNSHLLQVYLGAWVKIETVME